MNGLSMDSFDVVVTGGGPAGIAAAWAAAVNGAKTLLVEQLGFLGGSGTVGGVTMYINWKGMTDGGLTDLSGNCYRRLMQYLDQCGGRYCSGGEGSNCDFVDAEDVKRIAEALLARVGVTILYHTQLAGVEVIDGTVRGVRLIGRGLDAKVACRTLIDCTGDAAGCRLASAEVRYGLEGDTRAQPLTMIFSVGGVDVERLRRDPRFASDEVGHVWRGGCLNDELRQAAEAGEFAGPYKPTHVSMFWSSPKDPSVIAFNVTKVWDVNGAEAEALSQAEIEGRRQCDELVGILRRRARGFEECYLAQTGCIGVRETYRLVGRYTLTEQDVQGGVIHEDTIALCAHVMDSHLIDNFHQLDWKNRTPYGIPYRCLVPETVKGLLTAGRSVSGTHLAAGSYRVIGTAMTTGEAAGTAAALGCRENKDVSELEGVRVRDELIRQGALHLAGCRPFPNRQTHTSPQAGFVRPLMKE